MYKYVLLICVISISACSSSSSERAKGVVETVMDSVLSDTNVLETHRELKGIDRFIDSMANEQYLLSNERYKRTSWYQGGRLITGLDHGHPIIRLSFPVAEYSIHFSNPVSYFFAKWNVDDSSFMNGDDYLLMSWQIDSAGIKQEEKLFRSLIDHMGNVNFPCYVFRNGDTVYAICNRMSSSLKITGRLSQRIRGYFSDRTDIYWRNGKLDSDTM